MLSDDMLRCIFKDTRFNSIQLYEIANVCARFKRIATDVFATKYKGDMALGEARLIRHSLWLQDRFK